MENDMHKQLNENLLFTDPEFLRQREYWLTKLSSDDTDLITDFISRVNNPVPDPR
jgi:hypothetical protein